MESKLILKFLKFSVVGFISVIIDFGVTYLLKEKVKLNQYVANSLGFTVAVIGNFFMNKYWTFEDTNPDMVSQFTIFMIIAITGLLINNGIIFILRRRHINFYIAKGIAIGIVVFWNFFMNSKFSFA